MRLVPFLVFALCAIQFMYAGPSDQANLIYVLDWESGLPVKGALVEVNRFHEFTSENGSFALASCYSKDSLKIFHTSYQKLCVPLRLLPKDGKIFLKRKLYYNKEVLVEGISEDMSRSSFKNNLLVTDEDRSRLKNASDLLKYISGLSFKDYGGEGSLKTFSARGMSSENTVVLFNEARVNDLRTGGFDFSQITTDAISRIEFVKDADYSSGISSSGGILKLSSANGAQNPSMRFDCNLSSFGQRSLGLNYSSASGRADFGFSFRRTFSNNDFDYSFQGQDYSRKNAGFNKTFVSAYANLKTEKGLVKFYNHYSYFESGLPGYVVTGNQDNSQVSQKLNSYLGVLNYLGELSDLVEMHSTLSLQTQRYRVFDPLGQLFGGNSSISKTTEITFRVNPVIKTGAFTITPGLEALYSGLDDKRDSRGSVHIPSKINMESLRAFLGASWRIEPNGTILKETNLSCNTEYLSASEKIDVFSNRRAASFSLGAVFIPGFSENSVLKTNIFNNFRMPTFNEKYYSEIYAGGDIRPEKYRGFDLGLEQKISFIGQGSLSLDYYSIESNDKILWIPSRMAVQIPRNIAEVRSRGIELGLSDAFFERSVEASVNYCLNETVNESSRGAGDMSCGKYLVYSPLHRVNVNLRFSKGGFTVCLYDSFVSKRYYTADNLDRYSLDPYFIADISASYSIKTGNCLHRLSFSVYNLFNSEYFIIQSYPIPLRNYSINYSMEIK